MYNRGPATRPTPPSRAPRGGPPITSSASACPAARRAPQRPRADASSRLAPRWTPDRRAQHPGDIIDGGNEWYENTERRAKAPSRRRPSTAPRSTSSRPRRPSATSAPAARATSSRWCTTASSTATCSSSSRRTTRLKTVGGLNNSSSPRRSTSGTRPSWTLIEISALILAKEDDQKPGEGFLVDKILDKTGMKGTGKDRSASRRALRRHPYRRVLPLDARFISGVKDECVAAQATYMSAGRARGRQGGGAHPEEKQQLVDDVRAALYASKICSYAQGMNLIRAKSNEQGWNLDLGEMARSGRAAASSARASSTASRRLTTATPTSRRCSSTASLPRSSWSATTRGGGSSRARSRGSPPSMSSSLAYFDSYRRGRLPANLVQAQRDFLDRTRTSADMDGWHHTVWSDMNSADSITTSGARERVGLGKIHLCFIPDGESPESAPPIITTR